MSLRIGLCSHLILSCSGGLWVSFSCTAVPVTAVTVRIFYEYLSTFWTHPQLKMKLHRGLFAAFLTPVPPVPSQRVRLLLLRQTAKVVLSCERKLDLCHITPHFRMSSVNSLSGWQLQECTQRKWGQAGGKKRKILTDCQNRKKWSNIIIHRAWRCLENWMWKPTHMTAAATCPKFLSPPSALRASINDY